MASNDCFHTIWLSRAGESGFNHCVITGTARIEQWRLAQPFVIARETFEVSELLVVELSDGSAIGRGEASPTTYYDETPANTLAQAQDGISRLRDMP